MGGEGDEGDDRRSGRGWDVVSHECLVFGLRSCASESILEDALPRCSAISFVHHRVHVRSHSNLEAPSETTADYHHLEAPPRTAKLASTREESTPNNTTKLRSRRYSLVSVNPVASKATASKGPSGSLEQSETHTNTPEGHAEEDEEEDVEEDDLGDGDEALSVPLKAEKGRICPDHEEGSNFRALCGLSRGQGAGRAPASQADANLCGVNGLLTSRYMGLLFALEALNSVSNSA